MTLGYSLYYVYLLLSCIVTALLGLLALQRRVNKGALAFACLMFSAALFAFCYIFKASSLSVYKALFWLRTAYWGIVCIPVFWYIMICQYTGNEKKLNKQAVYRLFIIPAITLLLQYTNDYHYFYYTNIVLTRPGSLSTIYLEKGGWYWVQLIYSYLLFFSGYYLLLKEWIYTPRAYRGKLSTFLASAAVPLVANLFYHFGKPFMGIDSSPISYGISGMICVWGIYKYGVFNLVPIARDNVFEAMHDGVIVFDMQNRIVDFNAAAVNMIDGIADLVLGCHLPASLEDYFGISNKFLSGVGQQNEVKITLKGSSVYYSCTLFRVLSHKKQLIGKTLVLRNVTEQIRIRERLRSLATLDGLTNIFNRRYFLELGRKELEQSENKAQPISLILFDIDLFKKINDAFGHEAGDTALCTVARVCSNCLRNTDIFARYGGEEFICLLPNTDSQAAFQIAERIRRSLSTTPLNLLNSSIRITASFGVVGTDIANETDLENLLRLADQALYTAKEKGRNRTSLIHL